MDKKVIVIFLLAFFIRLIALNQSLWLDEAITARVVKEYRFWQIVNQFSPYDFHPPFYYLFMKGWTNIFGYSEIALRMPSILFSLLTGYVVYLMGGIWASIFFLFNPLIIYYSQEARMYMMVTFFLTLALYFIHQLTRIRTRMEANKRMINLLFFNLFSVFAFLTFYGAIFLIIPMLFYLLYKKEYRNFYVTCFMLSAALILISPLLWQQFHHSKESLALVTHWKSVLGTASIKNLLLIPLKFSFGRISFYPKWLYWLISGSWMIFVWSFVISAGVKDKKLMALFMATLSLGLIFSFYSPLLQYFRFLYLIPIISLLLVLGARNSILRIIIAAGFFILSLVYLSFSQFHREDWKTLAKNLAKDQPVYMILPSSDGLVYYRPEIKIFDLRLIKDYLKNKDQLTIIPYTSEIYGINYHQLLSKNNFYLEKTVYFRGLSVEFWRKKLKVQLQINP